jgi:hypothetical protein
MFLLATALISAVAIVVAVVRTQLVGAMRPVLSLAAGVDVLGEPVKLGESSLAKFVFTQFVFGIWVLLLLLAGVGAAGVPVKVGLALGAY